MAVRQDVRDRARELIAGRTDLDMAMLSRLAASLRDELDCNLSTARTALGVVLREARQLRKLLGAVWPELDPLTVDELRRQQLLAALEALPKHERQVLALLYGPDQEGITPGQVAKSTGWSLATVRLVERQALDKLRGTTESPE